MPNQEWKDKNIYISAHHHFWWTGSDELQPPVGKEIRYVNMSFKMEGDKIDPAGCVVKRSGHLDKQKGKLGKFLKKKCFI